MLHALRNFIICLIFLRVKSQEENGFSNFLTMAMQDYPAWVISQALDPTPIIPDFINITKSSLNVYIAGEIKNQKIFNYSNFEIRRVGSDILSGSFLIQGILRNFSVQAEYNVSGKVLGSVLVAGSGTITLKSSYVHVDIDYENFVITEDGYIDLSEASYSYYSPPFFYDLAGDFENLSAGGFENNVKELILNIYNYHDRIELWLPVPNHIKEYLTGLFETTPLSEIIRTTLRPPMTAAPTTPKITTITQPPTCPPCPTAATPFLETCPPTTSCQPCPTITTSTRSPITISHTYLTPTCPPPGESVKDPKFSRTVYESSLPVWPQRGHQINLGISAHISDGYPLQYQLISRYPFAQLTGTQSINFTHDVAEGTYVGPNNVMVMEVIAEVVGDPGRQSSAAVIIVFPKSG